MLALASVLDDLSRAGAASRANVGGFTASLLGAVAALVVVMGAAAPGSASEAGRSPWVPFVLVAGCVLSDRVGSWRRGESFGRHLAFTLLPVAVLGAVAARLVERGQERRLSRVRPLGVRAQEPPDALGEQRLAIGLRRQKQHGASQNQRERPESSASCAGLRRVGHARSAPVARPCARPGTG
jgi:hypothetical protein